MRRNSRSLTRRQEPSGTDRLTRTPGWVAAFAAAAILLGASPGAAQRRPETRRGLTYVAKVICGTQADRDNLQLVRGRYLTVVNLFNRGRQRVEIRSSVALAHPPLDLTAGEVHDLPVVGLDSRESLAIDCGDLRAHLFPFGFPESYIDGFLVIEATEPLSVSAVYTAAPLVNATCCGEKDCCDGCCEEVAGPVASIDVEVIEPVESAAMPDRPDLVPEPPELESDPPGEPGTGFCSAGRRDGPPRVVVRIRNIGTAPAGASSALVDFGAAGSAAAPVGPLAPGADQIITVPIPTPCFASAGGGCTFDAIADAPGAIAESLETNNVRLGRCFRAAQQ